MGSLVVPGSLVECVLDGSACGRRLVAGNDQAEAIVATLVSLATTASDEIGHRVFGDSDACSVEDVDQQSVADEESRAGGRTVSGADTVDRDRLKYLVRALAAQRAAHEVFDGVHPGALSDSSGSMVP